MESQRFLLALEFEGSSFCGWQAQLEGEGYAGKASIQTTLEKAIATVLRRPQERFPLKGCGRTDAGVHALEYFAHLDIPVEFLRDDREIEVFRHSLNSVLPPSIGVWALTKVPQTFHAIEDVESKVYEYRVLLRRTKAVLHLGHVYWLPLRPSEFPEKLLHDVLSAFVGRHDFRAFAAANSNAKTTVREVLRAEFSATHVAGEGRLLSIQFEGRGFLKQMVRNMVGMALDICQGKRRLSELASLLGTPLMAAGQRKDAGFCAPAEGLHLVKVKYRESSREKKSPT